MPVCCKTVIDLGNGRQAHVVHPIGTSVAITPDGDILTTPIVDFVHDVKTTESLPEIMTMPMLDVTTTESSSAPTTKTPACDCSNIL